MAKVKEVAITNAAIAKAEAVTPVAETFWSIATEFGKNIKDLYSSPDAWKEIAWNILK